MLTLCWLRGQQGHLEEFGFACVAPPECLSSLCLLQVWLFSSSDAALPLHHNQGFPPKEGVGVEVYLRAGRQRRMPHLWELLGLGGAAGRGL